MSILANRINFVRLSWQQFEDMCADLLEAAGFENVQPGGRSGEMGLDVRAEERQCSRTGHVSTFTWMVQCKHYAPSGSSVGPADIGEIFSYLSSHEAEGLLVLATTDLTAHAIRMLKDFDEDPKHRFKAHFWDSRMIRNKLLLHPELVELYFPEEIASEVVEKEPRRNPFKLLDSFTPSDHAYFFGREYETTKLLGLVENHSTVILFGESGTGKTSLLNAGLIPSLSSAENCLVATSRPLDDPMESVRVSLIQRLDDFVSQDRLRTATTSLAATANSREFGRRLIGLIEALQLNVLIVVDQAEEIFVRTDESRRRAFGEFMQIVRSQLPRTGRLCVLIVIREDFLGQFWEWTQDLRLGGLWHNTLRLSRLSPPHADLAISKPLTKQGVRYDQEFVTQLVQDLQELGNGSVYPPYLQIVCSALFYEVQKEQDGKREAYMDIDLYERCGGCATIITNYLEEKLFEGLTEPYRLAAQGVLDALTGTGGLRTLLSLKDLSKQTGESQEAVGEVVEILIQRRVVRPVTSDSEVKGYELVHDFLSRTFFERLSPAEQSRKRIAELFRKALAEWRAERTLIASDRLELFRRNANVIIWDREAITLVVESSLATNRYRYWLKAFPKGWRAVVLGDIIEQSPHVRARANAVKSLGTKQYWAKQKYWFEAYYILTKALNDEAAQVRRLAAKQLGVLGAREAGNALLNRLTEEKDLSVSEEIINTLGVLCDRQAVNALAALLEPAYPARPKIARAVVSALGNIGGEQAAQVLLTCLKQAMDGKMPIDHGLMLLLVKALGNIGYRQAADLLVQVINRSSGELRVEAIRALGRAKEPKAIGVIAKILELDRGGNVQGAIVEALGEIGDPIAIDLLLESLQSGDRDLLLKTLAAIAKLISQTQEADRYRVLDAMAPFLSISLSFDNEVHRAGIRVLVASTVNATLDFTEKVETLLKPMKASADLDTLQQINVALARAWHLRSEVRGLEFKTGDHILDAKRGRGIVLASQILEGRERVTVVYQNAIQRIWVDECELKKVQAPPYFDPDVFTEFDGNSRKGALLPSLGLDFLLP